VSFTRDLLSNFNFMNPRANLNYFTKELMAWDDGGLQSFLSPAVPAFNMQICATYSSSQNLDENVVFTDGKIGRAHV
jgi:hypothetical protein